MAAPLDLDSLDGLDEFATVRQLEYLEAVRKFASIRKASTALGVNKSAISKSIESVRLRAARSLPVLHDYTQKVPSGFAIRGVSQYIGKDGKVNGQWVKTSREDEKDQEAIKAAYEAMADDLPRLNPVAAPKNAHADLCNLYVMTDCHVGMLAWHKENLGEDWDLSIAERTLSGCFEQMVMTAQPARTAVIAQLGDWLHQDGILPVTPSSGHILDSDGRFSKVVSASLRILRRMIDCALTRHEKIYLLMAEGNHDISSSIWLRVMFQALYENEPRVEMIGSELPYYVHQHGETMLAFHHGHLKKNDHLPLLFAAQFPKIWGNTTKRYVHTGHRHHVEEKEHSGITVVQHPTLASRDAYASRGGWISDRQATATTYHSRRGKVATVTVTPEMLDA